jgi:hypothetical protein
MQADLPIRPDRRPTVERGRKDLAAGEGMDLPGPSEPPRPGTLRRTLLVARDPSLPRLLTSLETLRAYPYGCTEQRVSLGRSLLAFSRLGGALGEAAPAPEEIATAVRNTSEWIAQTVDSQGRIAYWPGGRGSVFLAAWSASFLTEARAARIPVDEKLHARLLEGLRQSLRSDYRHFVPGEEYGERAFALAALAEAGQADAGYAVELARDQAFLGQRALALVLRALERLPSPTAAMAPTVAALRERLWSGIVLRRQDDKDIYGGIRDEHPIRDPFLLPSEISALAETLRTLAGAASPDPVRIGILKDALLAHATDQGFGDTQADATALLALTDLLIPAAPASAAPSDPTEALHLGPADGPLRQAQGERGNKGSPEALSLSLAHPLIMKSVPGSAAMRLHRDSGTAPLMAQIEIRYLPLPPGAEAVARTAGLVVHREAQKVTGLNTPLERHPLEQAGETLDYRLGEVVEEHIELTLPQDAHHVALTVPLAAGMEPLNPGLATAPPEARPAGEGSQPATYVDFQDDQVAYYYDRLPRGTYHFYFRTRAMVPGHFQQPPASAEKMYDQAITGQSPGVWIHIRPVDEAVAAAPAAPQPALAPASPPTKPAAPAPGLPAAPTKHLPAKAAPP